MIYLNGEGMFPWALSWDSCCLQYMLMIILKWLKVWFPCLLMILSYIVLFCLIPILFSYKEMLTTSWMVQILTTGTNSIKYCTMRIKISDSITCWVVCLLLFISERRILVSWLTANSSFIVKLRLLLLRLTRSWADISKFFEYLDIDSLPRLYKAVVRLIFRVC